jgi:hypothetical protein
VPQPALKASRQTQRNKNVDALTKSAQDNLKSFPTSLTQGCKKILSGQPCRLRGREGSGQ